MATITDCLFCKIAAGEIPVTRLYEDDDVLAFPDIHPQAPVHILVIPKRHFNSLAQVTPEESGLLGQLLTTAATIAEQRGFSQRSDGGGFRVVINTGRDGGQTVDHLHLHLLAGRPMGWPPG